MRKTFGLSFMKGGAKRTLETPTIFDCSSEIYGGSHLKRGFEIHELNGYDLVNCFYLCIK